MLKQTLSPVHRGAACHSDDGIEQTAIVASKTRLSEFTVYCHFDIATCSDNDGDGGLPQLRACRTAVQTDTPAKMSPGRVFDRKLFGQDR